MTTSAPIRALRVTPAVAGVPEHWRRLLDLAAGSSVNGLVIDLKESGIVLYDSAVATANRIGAVHPRLSIEGVIEDLSSRGLHAIGRLAVFQDTQLVTAYPELSVIDSATGELWRTSSGQAWIDPTRRNAGEYALELIVEAARAGFDEIQIDYVRFPTDGPLERRSFSKEVDSRVRVEAISSFVREARRAVHAEGSQLAVDVFGVTATSTSDEGIGQSLEDLAASADVICPMVYPSHYQKGWLELEDPARFPAIVVGHALNRAIERIGPVATIRPWLQTWGQVVTHVGAQIVEAERRELGWMLWSPDSRYHASWLDSATPDPSDVVVISREAWQASPPGDALSPHDVVRSTIHHTGVALPDNRDAPQRMRRHQSFHQGLGWPDLAYHFAIDRNGHVYEGRPTWAAGDTATSYDPRGHLLIALDGDFNLQGPSSLQLIALIELLAWAAHEFGFDPETIDGHSNYAEEACPGARLRSLLHDGTITRGVRRRLATGPGSLELLRGRSAVELVAAVEAGSR